MSTVNTDNKLAELCALEHNNTMMLADIVMMSQRHCSRRVRKQFCKAFQDLSAKHLYKLTQSTSYEIIPFMQKHSGLITLQVEEIKELLLNYLEQLDSAIQEESNRTSSNLNVIAASKVTIYYLTLLLANSSICRGNDLSNISICAGCDKCGTADPCGFSLLDLGHEFLISEMDRDSTYRSQYDIWSSYCILYRKYSPIIAKTLHTTEEHIQSRFDSLE